LQAVSYNGSMSAPILATKLYVPPPRPNAVLRPRLIDWLNEGRQRTPSVALISAPAGFGKTTLVSEWIATLIGSGVRVAWLSLDEGDSDLARFLLYFVAAVQTIAPKCGENVLNMLQPMQSTEVVLTTLLNELAAIPDRFVLVLDDYHTLDCKPIDDALTFLVDHQPSHMQLVITTREDPSLSLARLRARGQLTELRAADLRFTPDEAAEFLTQVMKLSLSAEDIAALENRTEGWIAGLQLAAISMQGQTDVTHFIQSFTGSHHFVLDYLIEEVLQQQSKNIQSFLLRTSILDRLCGPLCEAVVLDPAVSGQETLEYLEHVNLFIVSLDNDRQWYRYHHLFADLLQQRLHQSAFDVTELHTRASIWYEDNGLEIEAFQHAAAANDVERAECLMESKGMPLHFRSAVNAILEWLASLPKSMLDARPLLWVRRATLALMAGQTAGVEEKLQAAEAAIRAQRSTELDNKTRDLIGQIAAARAMLALTQYRTEAVIIQSRRALEYLPPENLTYRFTANWTLSNAYKLQGDRASASRALADAVSIGEASGDMFSTILAISHLGPLQELANQLYQAAETYRRVLQLVSDQSQPSAVEAYLGLARICYEWNDLDGAEQHGQQSLLLARQYDRAHDRFILCEVFLARLKLAQGDVAGAAAILAQAERATRERNFVQRMPEVVAAQVLTLLRQGDVKAASQLAQSYDLPVSQARVHLAEGNSAAAIVILESYRQQMEAKGWADERLKTMVLQAIAQHLRGEKDQAAQVLGEALALAEPGGFIRLFVDEGAPMAELLSVTAAQGIRPGYANRLLTAFEVETKEDRLTSSVLSPSSLVELLSPRELEVLRLIAQGLSNQEIADRLFLALSTVKGYIRFIFDKLQVQRRTEAVARARELGLL
jgi:LuxR family maltose regulon positive regulatory protein